ncbi:MAG: ArsA family ATPase [Deltaproteobacteria bacterium]|nr:ArsA family ATPase [Deltaproteobacteria bacterium]MDH3382771.1 ArsA family ATPase [Deltaproteobacteria bacterium]
MCSEIAEDPRRFFFFMGKGGTGKSTVSALAACFLAARGRRVLLLSLDPAHNQADIFDRPFSGRPQTVGERVRVAEVDQRHWINRFLHSVQDHVRRAYTYQSAFNLDHWLDVLHDSPGIEEYAMILAFQHYRQVEQDIDVMILDMPPTGLAMKFLRLPRLSLRWLTHLENLRQEILRKKEIVHRIRFGRRELETDRILGRLKQQGAFYDDLKTLFENPVATRIHLVFNPDQLSIRESGRICEGLKAIALDRCLHPVLNMASREEFRLPPELFPGRSVPRLSLSDCPLIGLSALHGYLGEQGGRMDFLL